MSTFYITTPIYYVNGAPHIGHAYTTIIADALARYHRLKEDDVFFLTGTDEHGLKIQRSAEDQGLTPQELVDKNSAKFRQLFEKLELTYDRFIRTTDADHKKTVVEMVRRMQEAGDIYLGEYEGWYSASDEAYYDESEIEDGKAIASGSPVEWVKEKSYFFRLSKFGDRLLKWYEEFPDAVAPASRRNEVISFVESGLTDLSISRTTFDWGIPYPGDPEHVLYVWVDALTNYLTAAGAFDDMGRFEKYWPADVHLIGKEILRFHAIFWPAFLMSAGLPLPKKVFAHGWWINEGEKMSKSKGNFIDAEELAKDYELDVIRYYMMREIPLGNDGNFSKTRIVERNNADLADNIGNLVNRTLSMTERFLGGTVPAIEPLSEELDRELRQKALTTRDAVDKAIQELQIHRALEAIINLSHDTNLYIQTAQPWALNKEGNTTRLEQVLYTALESIRYITVLIAAFIPDAADRILTGLGLDKDSPLRKISSLDEWGGLLGGTKLQKPDVLFTKLELPADDAEEPEKTAQTTKSKPKKKKMTEKKAQEQPKTVSFDHVMSVELRVGEILTAEKVEGADKLLKLTANIGEETPRTIVAGIAKSFEPEELVGLRVGMVTNLAPAKLFGIESQAMILATKKTDGKMELARFPEDVEPGTRIS